MYRIDALQSHTAPATNSELDLPALWEAYRVSRDESFRNRLLIHYLPLSRKIARHLHQRMPPTIELDDLAQAAFLGLRSAISTFDPSRGIPFENYCGPRVRGAVLDYLRALDWAARMLRSRVHRMQEMIRQIEMSTGADPTDEQLSSALRVPLEQVRETKGELPPPPVRRTSTQVGNDHDFNFDLVDETADTPALEAQRADLREFLMRGLSGTERHVRTLYYYENMSLREIGRTLHLCESRVSQIHNAVIERLRERKDRIGGSSLND